MVFVSAGPEHVLFFSVAVLAQSIFGRMSPAVAEAVALASVVPEVSVHLASHPLAQLAFLAP